LILWGNFHGIYAKSSPFLKLTEEEKAFIAAHPVIRVSNEMDWTPFDFSVGSQPFGLSIDLMDMLAERLGITLAYVNGYQWNTLVEMFRNKEIDLLHSVYKNERRKQFGLFTEPYYKDKTVFVIPRYAAGITDISDLFGKIVAVPKGWAYETYLTKHYPQINLLMVKNMEEAFRAIQNGKADAAIELAAVVQYLMRKKFLDGIKISGWFRQYDQNDRKALHILVRDDWKILHGMLEKALQTITPGNIANLERKWLGKPFMLPDQELNLTSAEKEFLATHPVIRVANEMDWPPFDFMKNGQPAGFAIDYVNLLGEILDVQFDFVNGFSWPELLAKGQQKEVDLFPGLWKSDKREAFLVFTDSYVDLIKVLVVSKKIRNVESVSDMKGRRIALTKGYTLTDVMMREYPDLNYILVDNPEQGLKQVSLGKVDGFIGSLGIINFLIKKHFMDNIRVVSEVQLNTSLPLYMAVRKDWFILSSILNKAMNCVGPEPYGRLVEKWFGSVDRVGELTNLTRQEKDYLNHKEKIRLCVQTDAPPFEYVDEKGKYQGIVADFYQLLYQKIGLSMEIVPCRSLNACRKAFKTGKCDMTACVPGGTINSQESCRMLPYVEYPLVIATQSNALYIHSLESLPGKHIGISRSASFLEEVCTMYPDVPFQRVDNVEAGLLQVRSGELFGLVDTAPGIGFYIQKNKMMDLKISGELPHSVSFCAMVAKKDKYLHNIIAKAIHTLNSEDRKKIFQSWMTLQYEQGIDYGLLWKILAVTGVLGLFLLYRHVSMARYNIKLSKLNDDLIRANEKLEKISYVDGLTGVGNRRQFDAVFEKEWNRCARSRHDLSLIMLDLDDFKRFNDRYGHIAGDDCLKTVAETIRSILRRPGDFVGRYGGEEFAVVLPDTDKKGTRHIARKILTHIQEMKIPHEDSDVSSWVTVSLGAATVLPEKKMSREQLVAMADQELYKAKAAGKNQYRIFKL
jgi:diguanylate cyclase (GGDEF)-like protein